MESKDIADQYNNRGALVDWSIQREQVAGEKWINRIYQLFRNNGLIPNDEKLARFKVLVSASNTPTHAVYFAKNLERDCAGIPTNDLPVVVATDLAVDPLTSPIATEKQLRRIHITRINANASEPPLAHNYFDLITDFQGAIWYASDESKTETISLLLKYFSVLKIDGVLVLDDTYTGFEDNASDFTGGRLQSLGIIDQDGFINLGSNQKFKVTKIKGDKPVDNFLILKKYS